MGGHLDSHPSARTFKLATLLVGQRDNNAITNATHELQCILILVGNFVHVMPPRGNNVDRVVVASPVYRHTVVVVFFCKHTFDVCKLYPYSSDRALKLVPFIVG
jgi:hypothetical protein